MKKLMLFLMLATMTVYAQKGGKSGGGLDNKSADATTTLHTGTQLVVVDVVVLDKNKQPIHALKAEDFALLEDGASQVFKNFEEHVAAPANEKPVVLPKLPAGMYTNYTGLTNTGPLNVLLLDRLNTGMEDQSRMDKEIHDFISSMQPGARMAIFGLTDTKLLMLQGFTADPAILKAAINSKGPGKSMTASALVDDKVGGNGLNNNLAPSQVLDQATQASGQDPNDMGEAIAMMQEFEQRNAAVQAQLRTTYTLDALSSIAHYLASFPGRKNMLWFSGSFPVNVMPDLNKKGYSQFSGTTNSDKKFFDTMATLSRSQVAVYPINVAGLQNAAMFNAGTVTTGTGLNSRTSPTGTTTQQDLYTDTDARVNANATMFSMADSTGGKAAVDTNGLKQAIADDVANGANYYTIAYSPSNPNWDGTFRKIQVKLKESGYNISYRKGYFADNPYGKMDVAVTGTPASRAMMQALAHGGPAPSQLVFTARVQPVSETTETTLAPDNHLGKTPVAAPYKRYQTDVVFGPEQVKFSQTPDGHHHATLEFVACVYNADGVLVNSVGKTLNADIIPAAYAQFEKQGVPYHMEVSVPVKGEYFIRVAMHDVGADQVGAIEVPVKALSGVPPAMAAK